ncbi:uncharacterized protein LOC125521234 [Triticum urartu]|uniref:Transposase (putative) gypsy type domain-containing protein n=1 Tax=Triticum urartu TaxID=4572 RepID=A0A8R7UYJ7_TRIUA|nr:uncharacterized protein LOC125521233 [Triticum urartu]XP_048542254.1 uncharacterized protein LOC125521234 [Triticum urartu]
MPSSSSVYPEHRVVTAAELIAGNDAKETRATGAEGFASLLRTQEEVDALCDKYGVPKEFTARPAGDLRANSTPPPGAICVYARALEAGMRVPLHGFFRDVLAHFGIAPAQLTPNGWRFMASFLVLCESAGVPPSVAVFRRFFHLSIMDQKHEKGWYFFRSRRDITSLPNGGCKTTPGWRHEFFFLSSPEPWPCAVEWGEPSNGSSLDPALTVEENKSVVKLSAHGGAAADLRNLLPAGRCRICAAVDLRNLLPATCPRRRRSNLAAASPPPRPSSCYKGMDPSVHDMMKTMPADKVAAQASASAKKRTWEEASGRHDGHTTDWDGGRELLQETVAPSLERAFAASEPSDGAAIRRAANCVLELGEKLVARERDAAALREQLEEAKAELAAAKWAADVELEKAQSELAAAGAELEKTKAELAAVEAEVVKTKAELSASLVEAELAAAKQAAEAVKTKAERAAAWEEVVKTKDELAAEAELVQAKAELTAAKRAAETELVKTKAKLAAVEAELESAKAAAVQQFLASEEQVRQRAEDALEGYKRWRGHQAPAGRAA